LVGVYFKVQPFAGWIAVTKANIVIMGVAFFVGERAENGYVF
jgi:hypothetical protein